MPSVPPPFEMYMLVVPSVSPVMLTTAVSQPRSVITPSARPPGTTGGALISMLPNPSA